METLGTETSTKPQSAEEKDGREESDFSMPSLEEEREDGATEYDEELKEAHDKVGRSIEEYEEDLNNEGQGESMDEEGGVAKMCPDELGVGLRRRNRHD